MGAQSPPSPAGDTNSLPESAHKCQQNLPSSCPLLQQIMAEKGLPWKGIYSTQDAATIFNVSARTVQDWIRCGKLQARDLPGGGRFLSLDFEQLLQSSLTRRGGGQ